MTPTELLDPHTLQNLVDLDDGGHGLLAEMVAIFREDTPDRIRDLLAAAGAGDAHTLSRAAHALKGGAGALGARALQELAADLEGGPEDALALGPQVLAGQLEEAFARSLAALEAHLEELRRG